VRKAEGKLEAVMKKTVQNGAIIAQGYYYEEAKYHVSNEKLSAIFDGKGAVIDYSEANQKEYINKGFCCIHDGGKHIDVFRSKTVVMQGRKQTITIAIPSGILNIELFLDKSMNGVFASYELQSDNENARVQIAYMQGKIQDIKVFSQGDVTIIPENSSINVALSPMSRKALLFLTFSEEFEEGLDLEQVFETARMDCIAEIEGIKIPEGLSDMEQAMFYSSYFCALQNYKEKGDYKAFMAGHKYLLPMRSYYRDSYYTVLPMYNGHCDKVRNQILVLARGVEADGVCPSAVKFDYSAWWRGHYDSPSFLAMMIYDYVKYTKDTDLLKEKVGEETVLQQAVKVIVKLSEKERENGLLYKDGKYNKCDWTDEVNRTGYVTYDELLYARAHYCLSKLMKMIGEDETAEVYENKFLRLKEAINNELWDEERGYYVNFKNDEYTEYNLSVDTAFAVIFDIADKDRAVRMLKNMELILETRNNQEVPMEDFGVMCVYPPYSRVDSAYNKSSQPYNYHNGANWPYLSAIYAYAKRKYGMEYKYALGSWFEQNLEKDNYTPVEYYSPVCPDGSLLQAWAGATAFVMDEELSLTFWDE